LTRGQFEPDFKRSPNEMKTRHSIQAVVAALIAQVGAGCAIWLSTKVMAYHWHDFHGGKPLPPLTNMTLRFGMVVPIGAAVLILAGLAIPFLRARTPWWLLAVALFEVLVLAILMLGLAVPGCFVASQMGT